MAREMKTEELLPRNLQAVGTGPGGYVCLHKIETDASDEKVHAWLAQECPSGLVHVLSREGSEIEPIPDVPGMS